MPFFSQTQFVFLATAIFLFFCATERQKLGILLLVSLAYSIFSQPQFTTGLACTMLLIATALFTYWAGLNLSKRPPWFLKLSIALVLAPLFFYKTNFLPGHWIAPLGLSFYTFQSIGYLIDVSRGTQGAEPNLKKLCVFLVFFPQLVAGPIGRAKNIFPQLNNLNANLWPGSQLLLWGLFQKFFIAENLAPYVNAFYSKPLLDTPSLFFETALAIALYSFQIYYDFAGYTAIARGTGLFFGINLSENFRTPYLSTSVTDFWRRWHISLSTWFRDYLYIPLGGNQGPHWRVSFNLMIVFLVSGLWHGVAPTFVIWGALHGIAVIVERLIKKNSAFNSDKFTLRGFTPFATILTFIFVTLAWVFFRAPTLPQALHILGSLSLLLLDFKSVTMQASPFFRSIIFGGEAFAPLLALFIGIGISFLRNVLERERTLSFIFYSFLLALLLLGAPLDSVQFIYKNF